MVDLRNPCCRQCALEAHAEAGEVAPQQLVDAHAAAQASPVGRWIAEHTQAFLEAHLADVEAVG